MTSPRPLRNPQEVQPIWKGAPVGKARTAKKRRAEDAYLAEQRQVRYGWLITTVDRLFAALPQAVAS